MTPALLRRSTLPRILTAMTRTSLLAATLAAATLALAACGGGDETVTTSRTVAARPGAPRVQTNLTQLDQVLNTTLSADKIQMAGLTGYQKVPCAESPPNDDAPPACRTNEKASQDVEVLPRLGCKTGWVRPEDVPDTYSAALGGSEIKLAAVYAPAPPIARFGAQYIAVIQAGKHEDGSAAGAAFYFKDGRIVGVEDDCGSILRLLSADRVVSWIIAPQGSATPAANASPGSTSTR